MLRVKTIKIPFFASFLLFCERDFFSRFIHFLCGCGESFSTEERLPAGGKIKDDKRGRDFYEF